MPATDQADLILEDDEPFDPGAVAPEIAPWRILIVDDDVDVHVVTKFALSATTFQGRRLSFLHAYSGKEAVALLRDNPDIAMVLLDVIMETPDAGLRVIRQIRDDLHNELVRIVLRTGQPGQSLEHSIIVDYDINDFWCKADLTTRKLFTTVIAALRAYDTLKAAVAARDALNIELAKAHNVQAAVNQHALVITLDPQGRLVEANDRFCALAGVTRDAVIGRDLHCVHPGPFPERLSIEILNALKRKGEWTGDILAAGPNGTQLELRCAVLAFKDDEGKLDQYVAVGTALDHGA